MTKQRIIAALLLLALAAWVFITVIGPKRNSGTRDNRPSNKGTAVNYEPKFSHEGNLWFLQAEGDTVESMLVEFAESSEEVQYGMMYRKQMDENTGMLFFMPDERPQSFWMKNTYVPLDIVYINQNLEIVNIQENAEPLSEKSLPSLYPARYVLEVKGGYSQRHGLKPGMKVAFERLN